MSLVMQFSFDFGEFCVQLSINELKLLIHPSYGVSHGVDCHLEVVDLRVLVPSDASNLEMFCSMVWRRTVIDASDLLHMSSAC